MRFVVLMLAILLAATANAQDRAPKKKTVTKKQAAHKKPSPEQIRKFNQMHKQREAKG